MNPTCIKTWGRTLWGRTLWGRTRVLLPLFLGPGVSLTDNLISPSDTERLRLSEHHEL